jgi:hypothetical protein
MYCIEKAYKRKYPWVIVAGDLFEPMKLAKMLLSDPQSSPMYLPSAGIDENTNLRHCGDKVISAHKRLQEVKISETDLLHIPNSGLLFCMNS